MTAPDVPVTATTFSFGDGQYRFWLRLKQVEELERLCGVHDREGRLHPKSAITIFDSIAASFENDGAGGMTWTGFGGHLAREANEVLRLGLIGGNLGIVADEEIEVGPRRAIELLELYGYPERPMREVAAHAFRVLHAMIFGDPEAMQREAEAKAASSAGTVG